MYITAIGAMRDAAVTDFNPDTRVEPHLGREESVAPRAGGSPRWRFRSSRCAIVRAGEQTWGLQLRRTIPSKGENAFLTLINPQWGNSAIHHMEAAATLVGLEAPPPARNLEIKPYAISRLTTDLAGRPAVRNDIEPDAGLDVKYGLTQGLTANFTYNTDFAQVEVDEAQVNLTRFNLSFPEKRDFFIEGQGIFQFGTGGGEGNAGGGGDAPTIFYSRRIGLSGSRVIPVIAGGRVTGKAGPWSLGALNITTDDDEAANAPQTNFSVLRLRRDILRGSTIGGDLLAALGVGGRAGRQYPLGPGCRLPVLSERESGRLHCTVADRRSGRRRPQLSRAAQYNARSLWLGVRPDRRREEFQPRNRLPPAAGFPPEFRAGAVQPPHHGQHAHQEVQISGGIRIHDRQRQPSRNPGRAGHCSGSTFRIPTCFPCSIRELTNS